MDRAVGPLSVAATESVFISTDADLLVDDDMPVRGVSVVVTSSRLVIAARGELYVPGAALWAVPFERVTLHARMPPDLSSPRPTLYLQLDQLSDEDEDETADVPAVRPTAPDAVAAAEGWAALATCLELRISPVIGSEMAPDHASGSVAAEERYAAALAALFTAFDRAYDATGGGDDDDEGAAGGDADDIVVALGQAGDALPAGFGWITADTELPAGAAFTLAGPRPAIG